MAILVLGGVVISVLTWLISLVEKGQERVVVVDSFGNRSPCLPYIQMLFSTKAISLIKTL